MKDYCQTNSVMTSIQFFKFIWIKNLSLPERFQSHKCQVLQLSVHRLASAWLCSQTAVTSIKCNIKKDYLLQLLIALSLKGSTNQKNDNLKFKNLSLKKCNKLRTPNHSCSQSEESCKIQFLYSPLKHMKLTHKKIFQSFTT